MNARLFWFLGCVLCLLVGCGPLMEYLRTDEGQASGAQAARGVAGIVANPVNPLAWWDIALGGGTILAAALGLKATGKGLQAVGRTVKRHVLNPPEVIAVAEEDGEGTKAMGFRAGA